MDYQVIALDLDGTLLTPEKTILPASLTALQNARKSGAKVVIVTGRHFVAIHPFYQALALNTPAICCNGALLYDYAEKRVIASDPLQPEQATQLVNLLDSYNVHSLMYADDAMFYQNPTGHIIRTENWAKSLPESQRPVFKQVPSLSEASQNVDAIWKFALTDSDTEKLHRFGQIVERELGLACEWSWHDQVDIAQAGNSKGKRLAQWVESQGLSMSQVIAFGDNFNDLSMLETAGLGVAMGNAVDEVKACADLVIGNNTENGMRTYIDEQLAQFSFQYDDSLTTIENLKAVFALQRRIPSDKRRLVIELPGIQVPEGTEKAYESIKRKLTLGLTINPHLSLSTTKYIYNDLLLNSWNIHHLHLSEERVKNGFFKRTGPVLFCMFFENAVIFIDIMPHGRGYSDVWVNENLIKKNS